MPPPPRNLTSDVMYMIPQLAASVMGYTRLPRSLFTFASAPLFSDTAHPPACKPAEARGICNNVDRAQSALYHPDASYLVGHSLPVLSSAQASGGGLSPPHHLDAPHTAARGGHRARSSPPKASEPRFTGGSGIRDMTRNVLPGAQYRLALARRGNRPEAIRIQPPPATYSFG